MQAGDEWLQWRGARLVIVRLSWLYLVPCNRLSPAEQALNSEHSAARAATPQNAINSAR
jgi:hypothetical protein